MSAPTRSRDWNRAAAPFAAALLAVVVAYRGTIASLYAVWLGSDTYGHGLLILPISLWLTWRKRDALAAVTPAPFPAALLLLVPLGFLWFLGKVAGTLLLEQLAFVAMVPVLVCAFFGLRVTRILAFPLGFLFFAVPFGAGLQPWLRSFTADFAVRGLRWTGIPVEREGLYLRTTAGEWRVADACSGLRFLVSGFALGCLFAHLTFQSPRKRLLFGAMSLLVPILANGLRAYVLILVGTATDRRLGGGFDHYVYGWLAFTLVMAVFFFVGAMYRDPPPSPPVKSVGPETPSPTRPGRRIAVMAAAILATLPWPWLHASWLGTSHGGNPAAIATPAQVPGWHEIPDSSSWRPAFSGAASETVATYEKDGARVTYYIALYENQRQGRELIHGGNAIVDPDDRVWRSVDERGRRVRWTQATLDVRETDLRGPGSRWLVWHWYWLPDEFTANPVWAKLLQAKATLILHRDRAALILLAAPVRADRNAAADLEGFVHDAFPAIRSSLHLHEHP